MVRVRMTMTTNHWKLMLLSAALTVVACGGTESSDAEDAVDTSNNTSTESALMEATVDSDMASCGLSIAALEDASIAKLNKNMSPSGCFSAQKSGDSVAYSFNACT